MNRSHLQHTTAWVVDLANLTAGKNPLPEAKTKIAAMASMLADEYPPEALTKAALGHVVRQLTFFPSYGELAPLLSAWWRDHRPPPSVLAIERERRAKSEPADREEEVRAFWANMTPQKLRERIAWIEPPGATPRPVRPARGGPPQSVDGAARDMLIRSTMRGLEQHNPQLLGMLPPHWLPREGPAQVVELPPPPAEPEPRPKAYHLSREQLQAAYAAGPTKGPEAA